jgi:GNAT superfamily N-acetyltransferase
VDRVHHFLAKESYWSPEVPREIVVRAIQNSLCFGVYQRASAKTVQVGFARVISDFASFAYLCDVYIDSGSRGHGLSKWLIENVMAHPHLQGLRRFLLATKDAHSLYEKFGFKKTANPDDWMEIKDNEIYLKQRKNHASP